MSVCSGSEIVSDSTSASAESKRQSSTRGACSEKMAKLTPPPSHVAPSGYGVPGQTRRLLLSTGPRSFHVNGCDGNGRVHAIARIPRNGALAFSLASRLLHVAADDR